MTRDARLRPLKKAYGEVPEGFGRVGPLTNIAQEIERFDVNADALFASVGVSRELFTDPNHLISPQTYGQLLQRCAALSACPHFALLLAQSQGASSLGTVGELLPHCADVGTALAHLQNYLHLHDRAGMATRTIEGDTATFGYTLFAGPIAGVDQIYDGTLVIAQNIMRLLCGPQWKARAVLLARRRPKNLRPYQQAFQCPIEFDAESSSLVFPTSDLRLPVAGADPDRFKLLKEKLEDIRSRHDLDLVAQTRRVVQAMVVLRRCSLTGVSRELAMNPRRLNRLLERAGTTYRELLDEARCGLALRLICLTDLSLGQIAVVLDYSSASAFTHAFKRWKNVSPLAWRSEHGRSLEATEDLPDSR
ncbi:MAG: Virulence-regulating protein VirS [Candidatus Accumulibacter appositus]|mgnify:CR=1 FL=1|uniref:Virulence-regulating protein VirS n=1 Tax=Candidatus Accumulibacter appositus TaxID=1454003 RepID=A0A011PST1_9PROT|nr:AraC family transcriptional regulator [Accumulibacter sp.]EXI79895.1 MAG: Virulence-regulating protein VirS [Candidatus Accumulibacter appositus]HRF05459.1 AraC family transcriptional regulator [Accumulibacter sp.]